MNVEQARDQAENLRVAQNTLNILVNAAAERLAVVEAACQEARREHDRLLFMRERLLPVGHFLRREAGL